MELLSPPSPILISDTNQLILTYGKTKFLENASPNKIKHVRKIRKIYGSYNNQSDTEVTEVILKLNRNRPKNSKAPHPYRTQIEAWTLDPEVFILFQTPLSAQVHNSFYFVHDSPTFLFMMSNLASEEVLFVSTKETGSVTGLIQISSKSQNYVIDSLSLADEVGTTLKTVLESPSILKVVHACEFHVRTIYYNFQICLWPILDTQIVEEQLLPNFSQIKFPTLVEKYTSISTSKPEQILAKLSDYRKRPLHSDLLRYAMRDTYLLNLVWHKMLQTYGIEKVTSKEIQDKCKIASLKIHLEKKKKKGKKKGNLKPKKNLQVKHWQNREHFNQ